VVLLEGAGGGGEEGSRSGVLGLEVKEVAFTGAALDSGASSTGVTEAPFTTALSTWHCHPCCKSTSLKFVVL
jgi:hypothetical protein